MATLEFLPGPIKIADTVKKAFAVDPVSHRSAYFEALYDETKQILLKNTKASNMVMTIGSGTLANDIIATELRKINSPGLICANGEFGERLIGQGKRIGLKFDIYKVEWGEKLCENEIIQKLDGKKWLWLVHCETSVGAINLTPNLADYCKENGIKLCLDCISSIGNQIMDLSDIFMASGTSGKGLGSFPGVSLVFYNSDPLQVDCCPVYTDLLTYHNYQYSAFTFSHNLLNALNASLKHYDYDKRILANKNNHDLIKERLSQVGIKTPVKGLQSSYMWTFMIDKSIDSVVLGDKINEKGILLHYRNRYLINNNWIQMALMGDYEITDVQIALDTLLEEIRDY